jgi:hypothetical protein
VKKRRRKKKPPKRAIYHDREQGGLDHTSPCDHLHEWRLEESEAPPYISDMLDAAHWNRGEEE